jgi:hypothetical protein
MSISRVPWTKSSGFGGIADMRIAPLDELEETIVPLDCQEESFGLPIEAVLMDVFEDWRRDLGGNGVALHGFAECCGADFVVEVGQEC